VEPLSKGRRVKHSMNRVARLRVRKLEVEHFSRSDAMARRGQRYSGGCEVAEVETPSWYE
jgi:hypothetical protein